MRFLCMCCLFFLMPCYSVWYNPFSWQWVKNFTMESIPYIGKFFKKKEDNLTRNDILNHNRNIIKAKNVNVFDNTKKKLDEDDVSTDNDSLSTSSSLEENVPLTDIFPDDKKDVVKTFSRNIFYDDYIISITNYFFDTLKKNNLLLTVQKEDFLSDISNILNNKNDLNNSIFSENDNDIIHATAVNIKENLYKSLLANTFGENLRILANWCREEIKKEYKNILSLDFDLLYIDDPITLFCTMVFCKKKVDQEYILYKNMLYLNNFFSNTALYEKDDALVYYLKKIVPEFYLNQNKMKESIFLIDHTNLLFDRYAHFSLLHPKTCFLPLIDDLKKYSIEYALLLYKKVIFSEKNNFDVDKINTYYEKLWDVAVNFFLPSESFDQKNNVILVTKNKISTFEIQKETVSNMKKSLHNLIDLYYSLSQAIHSISGYEKDFNHYKEEMDKRLVAMQNSITDDATRKIFEDLIIEYRKSYTELIYNKLNDLAPQKKSFFGSFFKKDVVPNALQVLYKKKDLIGNTIKESLEKKESLKESIKNIFNELFIMFPSIADVQKDVFELLENLDAMNKNKINDLWLALETPLYKNLNDAIENYKKRQLKKEAYLMLPVDKKDQLSTKDFFEDGFDFTSLLNGYLFFKKLYINGYFKQNMFLDDLFKKLQSVEKNYMKKNEEDIKNKYDLKAVSSLCSYLAIYDDKKNPHTITFPVVTGSLLEGEHGSYREFSFDLKKMYHSVLVTAFIASYILGIRYSNQSGQYIIFPDIVEKIKSLFKNMTSRHMDTIKSILSLYQLSPLKHYYNTVNISDAKDDFFSIIKESNVTKTFDVVEKAKTLFTQNKYHGKGMMHALGYVNKNNNIVSSSETKTVSAIIELLSDPLMATVTIEDQKAFLAFLEGQKEHLFEIISLLIGSSLMKDASYFSQNHRASMSKCLDVFESLFLSVLDEETKQQKRLSESPIENDGLGEKLHKNISNAAELVVEKVVSSLKKAIIS